MTGVEMLDQECLLELTERYLKSLVAETAGGLSPEFDSSAPFGELGVDSFRVLKIIKSLEAEFGTLPKTLLFENFNIEALTRYFVDRHAQTLTAKFANDAQSAPVQNAAAAPVKAAEPAAPCAFVRLPEKDLDARADLAECVRALFERYKSEGGVSRGTRSIAPYLFIGGERRGYFNYGRSNNIILVYSYTGPEDYFPVIAQEMYEYCASKNLELNILADAVIESIGEARFSSTPFGVLQRVLNLRNFTLEGGAMRRLRYQVSKFEKAGACRTEEYRSGADKDTDAAIVRVIDQWCAGKPMVNPLIHIVREEIRTGQLHPQHRLFLTYVDEVLHNVILISALSSAHNGYLMDLEFYTREMPLGGLEFAIVRIIEKLAAEGCEMLSLGGTYGCRLSTSANADPQIDKLLDDLHKQNIFNDEGNLQFKNKFRPENRTIYLCRPIGGSADNVIDIIMMIADPLKMQSPDEIDEEPGEIAGEPRNHEAPASAEETGPQAPPTIAVDDAGLRERLRVLSEHGFNPLNIPDEQIEFDLKTDSWAQLNTSFVAAQMAHLRAHLQQPGDVQESLREIFPFKHFVVTDAGRTAERLLCKAWPKKGLVLENLLFPTGIYHQIDNGFTPQELPHPDVFRLHSDEPYKGNLAWDALQAQVAQRAAEIAFVCIELSDNAAGGCPVSTQHLQQVKELLGKHGVPLVIDATRVLENAQFLIEREQQHAGKTIWTAAREILACADVVVASLAKDFCVNKGGVIATNDEILLRRIEELVQQEGASVGVIDKKLIALALQNRRQIETRVLRRMEAVRSIWQSLQALHVPVSRPVGGHCVLIDVKQIPQLKEFEHPVASFLAWLYLNTGVRAGAHSVGMQKNSAIDGQVRLAVPVGLKQEQVKDLTARMAHLFKRMSDIPELALDGAATESFGEIHARYRLVEYHNGSQAQAADASHKRAPASPAATATNEPPQAKPAPLRPRAANVAGGEIAVVGMAGRYPKAKTLQEFWDNLRQGRDCIDELPQERIARRTRNPFTRTYRGGFLEDVDRFDSLFFNISPREAEVLDPQERLFLEVAWEAIEDAGYYPEILTGEDGRRNVGVFVGAVWAMYQIAGVEAKLAGAEVNPNSFLWSIANRASYWMNLGGPSMTVDTACSSSLTALYLACEAIRKGDCSSAIVGGVNLDLHQHKFDINAAGGALSSDGVCRSFGAGANGYVAGEGVGAVFIKPLEKALQDKDHIYGVIKSAVVNHGGRTSGYTVPSPQAQSELICAALDKAGVDARSIGYIEAHGTGTELGDPIEISGLTGAFEAHRVAPQSCPIGSVKTNIGHLEAAAGVVGLSKILLQMRHRRLVPSLHASEPNPHIDFERSPFYVQQQLQEWREKEVEGIRAPLRAGISSFGAGGANAHVIVESYEMQPTPESLPPEGCIFPLSARNDEQLREAARSLHAHLQRCAEQCSLSDVAFTLQNGRKSFERRLAIIARTKDELRAKLGAFLDGKADADVLCGHAKTSEGVAKLLSRKEREQLVGLLSQSKDARKLAQLWIDGLLHDLRGAASAAGRRTPLPTYPFADKRHWIAQPNAARGALAGPAGSPAARVHPLIDSNESTFKQQLFKKAFHAAEFFIGEHVVADTPTLPGVAYLDLARKAGEIAAGRKVRKIKNVTWVSPLTVDGAAPTEAFIELKPSGDSALFEVFSESADGKRRLYAQGKLLYGSGDAPAPAEHLDINAVQARCTKAASGAEAYPLFKAHGLSYGSSFQVLQEVCKNDDEALGLLKLPQIREADFADFVLHPCILDAAMQAGVAAQLGKSSGEMKVPYSIGEIELLQPLTRTCYSYVTKVKSEGGAGLSRENITIVDETGVVLARIRDSVGVPLVNIHEKPAQTGREEEFSKLYYSHVWEASPLAAAAADPEPVVLFDVDDRLRNACVQRNIKAALVLPGERFEAAADHTYRINPQDHADYVRLFESLAQNGWTAPRICYAWSDGGAADTADALAQALQRGVHAFLLLSQALIARKLTADAHIIYVYFAAKDAPRPHQEAMNGFARTLRLEHPKIHCKVVEIRPESAAVDDVLTSVLTELRPDAQDAAVRYDARVRYARTLKQLDAAELRDAQPQAIVLKERGVYLITGGVGGLGLIFAEFLAKRCQARLVLTGRSELSADHKARLQALKAAGADVLYIPADVSRAEDVQRVIRRSKAKFGRINGVIHGAGVLRDSYLRKKTAEEMAAVFAPKIYGTFHLDAQTRSEDLDFFVMFSSLAAVGGNAGQCDYAFANHYMDSFAAAREARRARGERFGKTLSLNWSLWADGGMKLDEQTELFFRKTLGVRPLSKEAGLEAFSKALSSNRPQIAVLEGVQAKIEQAWGLNRKAPARPASGEAHEARDAGGEDLAAQVMQALSGVVQELLKLNAEDLSVDSILVDLGFDSIGLTTFANAINEKYQLEVNPVLFFEHPSIRAVAAALVAEHADAVQRAHGAGATLPKPIGKLAASSADADAHGAIDKAGERSAAYGGGLSRERRFIDEPIAIVGIAGVMPQSENLDEFWENLKNARDLVTEIPRERWIWEDYDGNPVKEPNKSNSRWGGFMKEVDKFDPLFFGITPREAEMMDPQQRIFIETVWSAIEDSGHKASDLAGTKTGVFVGVSAKDYVDVLAEQQASLDGFSASGNSHSILANRISFLLNLRGPSAPIDTACSSSLIALHRAVESIHTGSSDMAIVGGVQVMLTPIAHISLSSAGMLSVDGKCKTFDKDANGYVRGEGVGAVFLKPLAKAQADGNPIYAVIKATAENHGGRVTMLTAPNPKAQAELLAEAYEKAHIDPASVGYIECHGTGTSLGDPIEIQALKKAFADLYRKHGRAPPAKPHCGLSSVKTNIGHLEPAAGIASLLKVLLAMKHGYIPALLHFQEINPYIDLSGSPFYIVDKTTAWEAPTAGDGSPLPRRAGVSSFGWGGANAHVVLEECLALPPVASEPHGPQLVVLSAKNEDRLEAYARALLAHIQKRRFDLSELAYTLQVGRDAMEERLGLIVGSIDELTPKLSAYLRGEPHIEGAYRGRVNRYKRNEHGLSVVESDAARSNDDVEQWIAEQRFSKLAEAWVNGVDLDWNRLHPAGRRPRRVSLPTYPFARDRSWINADGRVRARKGSAASAPLHPLLHNNDSTFGRQSYRSIFDGKEFFLTGRRRALPQAVYLEMARAAVAHAKPGLDGTAVLELRDTQWSPLTAIAADAPVVIDVFEDDAGVVFEIHSAAASAEDRGRSVIHCRGRATIGRRPASARLDIERLKAQMRLGAADAERVAALNRGSLQAIRAILQGDEQLLVRLEGSAVRDDVEQGYVLHPALLDGALHAAAALAANLEPASVEASRPLGLEMLHVLASCAGEMYAWVRYARGVRPGDATPRLDIDLCDSQGEICARIRSLTIENIHAKSRAQARNDELAGLLDSIYRPQPQAAVGAASGGAADDFERILEEIL